MSGRNCSRLTSSNILSCSSSGSQIKLLIYQPNAAIKPQKSLHFCLGRRKILTIFRPPTLTMCRCKKIATDFQLSTLTHLVQFIIFVPEVRLQVAGLGAYQLYVSRVHGRWLVLLCHFQHADESVGRCDHIGSAWELSRGHQHVHCHVQSLCIAAGCR